VLLALGLDEFSMSATSILPARSRLLKLRAADWAARKDALLNRDTAEDVLDDVQKALNTEA
jgi:phosphotransferase system enzyme I (PtsI)